MTGFIGVDTHRIKIEYLKKGTDLKKFETIIGVGITTQDYEKFCDAYKKAIQKTINS